MTNDNIVMAWLNRHAWKRSQPLYNVTLVAIYLVCAPSHIYNYNRNADEFPLTEGASNMKRKELIAFEDALVSKGATSRAAKARANAAYEYLVWIETGYIKQREQHDADEEAASRDLGAVA